MTDLEIVKSIHLIAAAVWTGGLLVLAFSVTAIRSATDDTEVLRSVARMFARVSWIAMGVAVVSGVWLYLFWNLQVSDLSVKWALIGLSIALALGHNASGLVAGGFDMGDAIGMRDGFEKLALMAGIVGALLIASAPFMRRLETVRLRSNTESK